MNLFQNRILLLLLSCFLPLLLNAQAFNYLDQNPFPKVRDLILSFEFDSAKSLVLKPEKDSKREAVRLFYLSQLSAWQFVLTENDEFYEQYLVINDKAHDAVEDYDDEAEFSFLNGELHFWKTLIGFRKGETISPVWNGNKAFAAYEKADQLDPKNPDILKGIGLAHFMVGIVPKNYKWITSVFGFSGTMSQGLSELEISAKNGKYGKTDAQFFLAAIKLFVDREGGESYKMLQALTLKYPKNGIYTLTACLALQRDRQVEAAVELCKEKLDYFKTKLPAFSDLIELRLGECQFLLNDFKTSEKTFVSFLDGYGGKSLKPIAYYRLAISQEMNGKHEEAKKNFEKIEPRSNFEFEIYSKAESEKYLKRPMSLIEKQIWIARNTFDCGKFSDAIGQFNSILRKQIKDDELAAEIYYRLGRAYEESNQTEKAMDSYEKAKKYKVELNRWVGALSLFQQGKILAKSGKKNEAATKFISAYNFGEHAFENSLSREIDTELKKLE